MLEQSIPNLFKKFIDTTKHTLLLSKVYFDIRQKEKTLSFFNTHPKFRMEIKKNSGCLAVWLASDKKRILGIVKTHKKRCILECLTKEQSEEGKKFLENNLKEAVAFRAYSYQSVNLKLRAEKTPGDRPHTTLPTLDYLGALRYLKDSTKRTKLVLNDTLKKESSLTCFRYQIQDYKQALEKEILIVLDAGFRLLRAVEKIEVFNPFVTKALPHLTQLIDKLSDFAPFLEETQSFATLKKIEKQLYLYFDEIEAKFLELLEGLYKKEKVIGLYLNKNWNHFEDISQDKTLIPLPCNVSKALMAGWRSNTEQMILSPDMDLVTILQKQPIEWLEAIYTFLGLTDDCKKKNDYIQTIAGFLKNELNLEKIVQKLSFSARKVLSFILEAKGMFSYRCLVNVFGDDIQDGFYWREKPPKSIIGISRARGLLFVGHIKKASNMIKVALIPSDLRLPLQRTIATPGNNHHLLE
jgi:hypothetical protein